MYTLEKPNSMQTCVTHTITFIFIKKETCTERTSYHDTSPVSVITLRIPYFISEDGVAAQTAVILYII